MVSHSLCAGDMTLLLTADNANLIKALEDVKAQSLQDIQQDFVKEDLTQNDSIEEADATIKVPIIDAMAILQCMKKKNEGALFIVSCYKCEKCYFGEWNALYCIRICSV